MWLYYHLAIYRSRSFVGFRDQRAQARPNLLPLPRCRYAFLRAHDRRPQPAGVRLDVPAGRSTPFFVVLHCTTCGKLNSACGDRSIKKAPKICCFSPSSIARRKTSGPWLCKIWCSRWEREVSGRHSPFNQLPRYLLRDRDAIFGDEFRGQVRDLESAASTALHGCLRSGARGPPEAVHAIGLGLV